MPQLKELKCIPCRGDSPPLTQEEVAVLKPQVSDWAVIDVEGIPRLQRVFKVLRTLLWRWRSPTGWVSWQRQKTITRRC